MSCTNCNNEILHCVLVPALIPFRVWVLVLVLVLVLVPVLVLVLVPVLALVLVLFLVHECYAIARRVV
ncbi:MAG TPA: hypothetical protein DEF42_00685 [Desulfosporosinus sp.]|nr:hypothetical protein [Desulfosporosinus sp.]